jgi:hypothetical protein
MESLIPAQHAPDQDLSDLLDDPPSRPNQPPSSSSSSFILPSRFFLPDGGGAGTYPSQGVQDVEAFLAYNAAQNGRGEYHGSASVHRLVELALEFRDGVKCEPMPFEERFSNRRREFWEVQDVSFLSAPCDPG